jgi:Meiotically up-regulated gene 113
VALIPSTPDGLPSETLSGGTEADGYGFVYLLRGHPGECKIGYTRLVDRRVAELGATASVEPKLIHEIKTDDPSGVEAYWHKRFESKRMRGEWFRLSSHDVRAFKRWRRLY